MILIEYCNCLLQRKVVNKVLNVHFYFTLCGGIEICHYCFSGLGVELDEGVAFCFVE